MRRRETYHFTIDDSGRYTVRRVGGWGVKDACFMSEVRTAAEALARDAFGYEYWCASDAVSVLSSDCSDQTCVVVVEGPVGDGWELNIRIPDQLWNAMMVCETNCFASCCGLDAFEIDHRLIRDWARCGHKPDLQAALGQIAEIKEMVSTRPGPSYSRDLQYEASATEWVAMLDSWEKAIKEALAE